MKSTFFATFFSFMAVLNAQKIDIFFEDADNFQRIKDSYALIETNSGEYLYKADKYGHIHINSIHNKFKVWFYAEHYIGYTSSFNPTDDLEIKAILSNPQHKFSISQANDKVLMDGLIIDRFTGEPVQAQINFMPFNISFLSKNGKFILQKKDIPNFMKYKEGDLIRIEIKAPGYKIYNETYKFSKATEYKSIELSPIEKPFFKNSEKNDNPGLIKKLKKEINDVFGTRNLTVGCGNLPTSIRVGLNCNCNSCSSVATMTLYDYVRKGINDEWIGSWHIESLKAGTLPYKSYGAYYVLHPINPNYDISSTTCKQVWDSDLCSNCTAAADATQGIFMVTPSDNIARTEYSAENNGLNAPSGEGCGDGYAGTGSSWPCISDNVCAGHDRFGHGRGMCQWGSQRWANNQFKNYEWIADHYYNPGYMYRCNANHPHPDLTGLNPTTDISSVAPGYTVNTTITIQNVAQVYSDRTRIGYYLSTDTSWDNNDIFLGYVYINSLESYAQQNISKSLTIPVTVTDGSYNLLFVEDYQNLVAEGNENNNLQSLPLVVSGSSSVADNYLRNRIQIVPNPADNYILLRYKDIEIKTVEIYNLLGQKLAIFSGNVKKIHLSELSSGTYLIKITDNKNHQTVFRILKK